LKPKDSLGISLKSGYAKNLRVLFVFLDRGESLGIIAVVGRDKVSTIERQLKD
jgi:hypothetical protein